MQLIMEKEHIEKLESIIQYCFKNKNLLIEALSHPSLKQCYFYKKEIHKDYERLELLGDAIISFVITELLFHNYSSYNEGQLAKLRSFLICKDTLCKIAFKINLPEFIIMTKGEEISGGRSNYNNIENAMEALISAIYLDSNINQVKLIISNLWQEFLFEENLYDIDPKSTLQEWAQSKGYNKPSYKVLKKEGLPHSPLFTVVVVVKNYQQLGKGNSIKIAEKLAAQNLLLLLNNVTESE